MTYKLRDISAWIQTHKSEIEKQSLASYLGCATVNAPLNNAPTGAHR